MKLDIKRSQFRFAGPDQTLADHPTQIAPLYEDKAHYRSMLGDFRETLSGLQQKLYADNRFALLLVFQGMDAAGKDGAIRHVFSGVNPQGCQVFSFKQPSKTELDHDFLWRTNNALPERGRIGIFNRSYYEEVLVVRVHPELLGYQRLPVSTTEDEAFWEHRLKDIRNMESHVTRQGTKVIKFFLNVSKDEQKRRFLDRINEPESNWKFAKSDIVERGYWDDYQAAYEAALQATSRKRAPWYVIPADDKKNARLIISRLLIKELKRLPLAYPVLPPDEAARLQGAKEALLSE